MNEKQLTDLLKQVIPWMRAFFHKCLNGRIPVHQMSDTKTMLVTDTVVKVIAGLNNGKLEKGYDFRLMVYMCMKDIWKDYVRKRIKILERPRELQLEEVGESTVQDSGYLSRFEARNRVQELMKHMKPADREMIQSQLDGLKLKDFAAANNKNYESLKVQMMRVRKWMRDHLDLN